MRNVIQATSFLSATKKFMVASLAVAMLAGCGASGPMMIGDYPVPGTLSADYKDNAASQITSKVAVAVRAEMQKSGVTGTIRSVNLSNTAYSQGGDVSFIAEATVATAMGGEVRYDAFGSYHPKTGVDVDYIYAIQLP